MADGHRPLVTIGVCTYNRADGYFVDALRSAVAQSYPNLEIVVSDNGSTDHTEEVVESFGDLRIRYVKREQNIGPVNNFNACLGDARGEFFLLLHDDDVLDPDFVEACMDAVGDDTDVGVIRTGTRIIDAEGRTLHERPNDVVGLSTSEFFRGWFAGRTPIFVCSTLHNTRRLRELGGFTSPRNLFPDTLVAVRLAALYGRADVKEPKASFRRHGQNTGNAARVEDWCEDSYHLLGVMQELVPEEAEMIRRKGSAFFSRTNYRHASSIESPVERARTCWRIYRRFGFAYSPLRFFFPRMVRRPIKRLGSRAKSRLGFA